MATYDIMTYQGDTLPVWTLSLANSDGGTWLGGTDTVEALYRHWDGSEVTENLTIISYGDVDTPATVALPAPCAALDPVDPDTVAVGPGDIVVTRVTTGGDRETMTTPKTYQVLPLSRLTA